MLYPLRAYPKKRLKGYKAGHELSLAFPPREGISVPKRKRQAPNWRVPGELWDRVEPLLPRYRTGKQGGRPRADLRPVLNGILYVLRTGCQWKAAPREFGCCPSTLHNYFQEWTEKGVFFRLWKEALWEYDELKGTDWGWKTFVGTLR